jgi:hypothetical protein
MPISLYAQITTVYLLPFDHVDDSASTIAQRTRHYLSQLCSLLDSGIRRCLAPQPILFPIFFAQDGGNVVTHSTKEDGYGHGQQPSPIVQCQNEHSARFSSAHDLLHSFAVSYRICIMYSISWNFSQFK